MSIFPIRTDSEGRTETKYVDHLSDQDLSRLNDLLPWQCFTLDSMGRQFGKQASASKRSSPQIIPDPRITELNRRFPLTGQSVLEVGCFEGIHTIALLGYGAKVIGIDSRIENVVKTMIRTWSFGFEAKVFKCDVEQGADFAKLPEVDITQHMGVLYHLVDPVTHLKNLLTRTRKAIMLDSHYALEHEATNTYHVAGTEYRYKHFWEGGREAAFAGMYDHAKWLLLDSIIDILKSLGFLRVEIAELRDERNGARVLLFAERTGN
jgi:SAM-dependent methyltransferase